MAHRRERARDEDWAVIGTGGLLRHPLLSSPPTLSLWGAPTDNDLLGGAADNWRKLGLDRLGANRSRSSARAALSRCAPPTRRPPEPSRTSGSSPR
ncbi:hypothetical protein ACFXPE_14795 [Streptomyces scopuliridis]|uniref:hypothetical protein n=1 Tax=Streptomyces scopuliridis TaxID=452529 RepID=UPI0036CD1068